MPLCSSLKLPTLAIYNGSRTGSNVDSLVECADFILGLVCATAHVEPSVVLVLKSSNGRDKRRSSDNGGLHFDFGIAMAPVFFCVYPLKE
jgi:hypothetical protein